MFNFGMKIVSIINPTLASKIRYKHYLKKRLDLKNPKTLNEKMMFLKLNVYWEKSFVAEMADKFAARSIVDKVGCSEILNKLLGVWDDAREINWDSLPAKFVLKCNHGSGFNIICYDKSTFDFKTATKKLNKWMKCSYGVEKAEQGIYRRIKRKIIAEEFIETKDGLPPKDYKFFCSYGEVKFLFVASDRIDGNTKFDYYYPNWEWIPVRNQHPNAGPIQKPPMLDKMIEYAKRLSKDLPLIRIDLYNEGTRIIFGEFTFTHFGCLNSFDPDNYDLIFGNCFPNFADTTKKRHKHE